MTVTTPTNESGAVYNSLPAKARQAVYWAYTVLGISLGAVQVAYATLEHAQPGWLKVALAVFTFLGGAVGIVAATNTNKTLPDVVPTVDHSHDVDTIADLIGDTTDTTPEPEAEPAIYQAAADPTKEN